MLLLGVLEGITCGSFSGVASISATVVVGFILFYFFSTLFSIVPLAKLFFREEKIFLGS